MAKAHYTPIGRTDVTEKLESILARSMSKDPAKRPVSMYAFAEELRWAQFQMSIPPTALEVAATEWAAAAPINLSDAVARGPVISTVNKNSRRAARAAHITSRVRADEPAARPQASGLKAGLIGAGIAIGVLVVAVVVLVATGVI